MFRGKPLIHTILDVFALAKLLGFAGKQTTGDAPKPVIVGEVPIPTQGTRSEARKAMKKANHARTMERRKRRGW